MGWTNPDSHVWAVGEVLTAANMNTYLRLNLDFLGATTYASISASETTASTAYVDLATTGPTVTILTGANALVICTADAANTIDTGVSWMSFAVSGATVVAAADANAYQMVAPAVSVAFGASAVIPIALTAGSNTFTAKYRVNTGTGTWLNRRLSVIPLP